MNLKGMIRYLLVTMISFTPFVWAEEKMVLPAEVLEELNSATFEGRESAEAKLKKWATGHRKEALLQLPELLKKDHSPETSARILKILRELYLGKRRGFFGINFALRPGQTFEDEEAMGVLVRSVTVDSPAQKAGLQANDVILAINGEAFSPETTVVDVRQRVSGLEVGARQRVTISRKQKQIVVIVRPVEREEMPGDEMLRQEEFKAWLSAKLR